MLNLFSQNETFAASAFEPRGLVLKGNGKGYRVGSIADNNNNNDSVVIVGKMVRKTQGIMN